MPLDELLAPLIPPLFDLARWFDKAQIPYAIVGGVAAGLQGRPRATRDIDAVVLIEEGDWGSFLADAAANGFCEREGNSLEFAARSRVMLLEHDGTRLGVDISLGAIALEHEIIARAIPTLVEGFAVRLATPEDLIIMKSLAMRPVDISDITSLIDAHPKLDLDRVRQCVRELAEALESPDIASQFDALLRQRE